MNSRRSSTSQRRSILQPVGAVTVYTVPLQTGTLRNSPKGPRNRREQGYNRAKPLETAHSMPPPVRCGEITTRTNTTTLDGGTTNPLDDQGHSRLRFSLRWSN